MTNGELIDSLLHYNRDLPVYLAVGGHEADEFEVATGSDENGADCLVIEG
jgi:hypothetical protein